MTDKAFALILLVAIVLTGAFALWANSLPTYTPPANYGGTYTTVFK